jgi:hypothetical protein
MTFPFVMWSVAPFVERPFRPGLGDQGVTGGAEFAAGLLASLAGRRAERAFR